MLLLASILLVAVALTSCGTESSDDPLLQDWTTLEEPSAEFEVLAREVLLNMTTLPSYAMDVSIGLPEQDARGEAAWTVEFEAPDSYRLLNLVFSGPEEQVCDGPPVLTPNGSRTCYSIMARVDGITVTEMIMSGHATFVRQCKTPGSNCSAWERGERPRVALAGPSLPTFRSYPSTAWQATPVTPFSCEGRSTPRWWP
jgi:hypothetical protein